MAAAINTAALTFSADQLRSMRELLLKAVLEAQDLTLFHELETGIKNDREIGLIPGTLGLMGKARQGCNPTADTLTATAVKKTWTPRGIEVILDQCYTDLDSYFTKMARNAGTEIADLTNTEYFAFILSLLEKDIPKMILRKAWFDNTSAANVSDSPAGVITDGVDADYFNQFDGLWYQLGVILAAHTERKTSIAANAQATTALQFSAFTPALALAALNAVIDDAPATLAVQPDRMLIVTHSVFQKAYRALQAAGLAYKIELQSNGFQMMQWDGVPMYSVPLFDEWIRAYESNGTKLNNPHRIVYTTKSNLKIGFESESGFSNVNSFYDQKSRVNRIEFSDAMDSKVLNDELLQVGI